jgi:hypothetical protein
MQSSTRRGILLENTSDISLHDIRMEIKEGSALEAKDSKGISYDKVTVTTAVKDKPYIQLVNCQNIRVTNCFQPEVIPLFVNEDEKSRDFYIMNNIFPGTTELVSKKGSNYSIAYNLIKK